MPAYDDASFSPDPATSGADDPRLLLWAAGELDALPQDEARALRKVLEADPAVRAAAESLRDDLDRMAVLAGEASVNANQAARVGRETKRALRAAMERPAVAGRIVRPVEADASSQVWRWVRWPLAAAAAMVVGLTTFILVDNDINRPGGLALGTNNPVVTPSDPPSPPSPPSPVTATASAEENLDERAELLVAMFEMPSLAWESSNEAGEVSNAEAQALMVGPMGNRGGLGEQLATLAELSMISSSDDAWGWDELGG